MRNPDTMMGPLPDSNPDTHLAQLMLHHVLMVNVATSIEDLPVACMNCV